MLPSIEPRQLVIIAGGKGTRLKEVLGDKPKPLAEVGGRSLLDYQLSLAHSYGFQDVLVLTGYGAEHIERELDGRARTLREPEPLGTAGAVLHAFDALAERFVVMYGDTMLNVDLNRLWKAHPRDASATLFLHPNDHPHDSDLVAIDDQNRVVAFHPYPHPQNVYRRNLVNAALYVFEKEALAPYRSRGALDFGKNVLPEMVLRGQYLNGYVTREYIKDAGTPKRLDRVRQDYESRRIANSALDNPLPAVFFDRDGTLNDERDWLRDPEQLKLLPGAADAVRLINERGWLSVVITNQPVIARGECTEAGLRIIHDKLEWLLGEQHAYLDGVYYCPHHPDAGFPGERVDLKIACACRKPGIELVQRAVNDLNIDLAHSWFIGDRASDVQTGTRAGMSSVLVHTGPASQRARQSCEPTLESPDVLQAVRTILTRE